MGFFTGSIYSEALGMDTSIGVVLPQDSRFHDRKKDKKPATLFLLHGLSDNWAAWGHRSRILQFAEEHDVAVVMPEVQRSFYQDMVYGEQYFTYVSRELPALAASLFNVSVEPEDRMIAGLSMGGYGALRCALSDPKAYRAVGAFSSACDIEGVVGRHELNDTFNGFGRVLKSIFGQPFEVPEDAILKNLADQAKDSGLPVMMTCGEQDGLMADNQAFFDYIKGLGMNATFETWTGMHEWRFWDTSIEKFLNRFA